MQNSAGSLIALAQEFSPRYERNLPRGSRARQPRMGPARGSRAVDPEGRDDLISIDVSGLDRLLGPPRAIGEALGREASARGLHVQVAVAGTQSAAMVLALARPGLTVVEPGQEADALASLPIGLLEKVNSDRGLQPSPERESLRSSARDSEARQARGGGAPREVINAGSLESTVSVFQRWGINTLGELAALPAADLVSRLGRAASVWQAIARGEDVRPFVPAVPDERFEASLELEWPIDGLEPLSFVLTRLLEPLSTRLERRDRGAAVLHVELRLVTRPSTLREPQGRPEPSRGTTGSGRGEPVEPREIHRRRLELPSPMRDVRTLRTIALLDLESHPPAAAIDRVAVVIDPTPGPIVQHTLFTRAHPTPEQLSTLVAHLDALMGAGRVGAPATVDSYRPGAFAMEPFAAERDGGRASGVGAGPLRRPVLDTREHDGASASASGGRGPQRGSRVGVPGGTPREVKNIVSALRRCRQPVPARVAVSGWRPVRVTTDRRGFAGGSVVACAGPWRTSGQWWACCSDRPWTGSGRSRMASVSNHAGSAGSALDVVCAGGAYSRDEWDVTLADGAVYRIFRDRQTDGWFIDGIVD